MFLRRGTLFAVKFDVGRVEVQGAPEAVLDNVAQALTAGNSGDVTGAGQFAVAPTGALAWIRGPVNPYPNTVIAAVDRRGQVTPLPGDPRSHGPQLRVSPDGRRLAMQVRDLTNVGLWLYDFGRETATPLVTGGEVSWHVWSPDGRRLAFSWLEDGQESLAVQPDVDSLRPKPLLAGEFYPSSWTRDGRQLVG